MLFAALVLGACLLMTRVLADPRGAPLSDPRLIGLGLLLGADGADPERGGLARAGLGMAGVAVAGRAAVRAG